MIIVCHTIQQLCVRFARSPIDATAAAVSVACASPGASAACAPAAAVALITATAPTVAFASAIIPFVDSALKYPRWIKPRHSFRLYNSRITTLAIQAKTRTVSRKSKFYR